MSVHMYVCMYVCIYAYMFILDRVKHVDYANELFRLIIYTDFYYYLFVRRTFIYIYIHVHICACDTINVY